MAKRQYDKPAVADGVKEAVTKLEEQASALKGRPIGIKRIQKLSYTGDNIVV